VEDVKEKSIHGLKDHQPLLKVFFFNV